jgi:hypothetical protein
MITNQEKRFLYKKKLKEGMTISEINKYFEKLSNSLKSSKKKIKKPKDLNKEFQVSFKNLKIV